jgi:methylmalonyl-CoA mutase cobalamin-binding subunit
MRNDWGQAYSSVLDHAFPSLGGAFKAATSLLASPDQDAEAIELDSHERKTQDMVGAVRTALERLGQRRFVALQATLGRPPAPVPDPISPLESGKWDFLAVWIIRILKNWPSEAHQLAVSTIRLIEECRCLDPTKRLTEPLGVGFEDQLEKRLALRVEMLSTQPDLLQILDEHWWAELEDPVEGLARIEESAGRRLARRELRWLDMERFVGMLEIARSNRRKTEGYQIRRFLRRDPELGVVLDRYGMHGHWLVAGNASPGVLARAGTLAAWATDEMREAAPGAWRTLIFDGYEDRDPGSSAPSVQIEEAHTVAGEPGDLRTMSVGGMSRVLVDHSIEAARHAITAAASAEPEITRLGRRHYSLRVDRHRLVLEATGGPRGHRPLADVALDAEDGPLIDFMDALGRVAEVAHIIDRVEAAYSGSGAVRWARAVLRTPRMAPVLKPSEDLSGLNVRLVYVPASLAHPLGGLPTIGLRFLADELERVGARATVMTIGAQDLQRRRVELLGADVIGLSYYITNRREVARLVKLLREAGFAGRIVLGGPELRDIDEVQSAVSGWDALIRGEGEEVFPDVLRVLRHLDAGEAVEALRLARTLRGAVIAHGDLTILADTAVRNAAAQIVCPLPFEWRRYGDASKLEMNFTRGCPYNCTFCPNHQGRHYHSCGAEELWRFTRYAAADAFEMSAREEKRCARVIQSALGVTGPPRLPPALNLLLRSPVPEDLLDRLCPTNGTTHGSSASRSASSWIIKQRWLDHKATLLARWVAAPRRRNGSKPTLESFELMTSEDNTLVNENDIVTFMDKLRASGLCGTVIFDPGQNTVRDLTDHQGGIKLDYVDALAKGNPFKVVLGVDGTSNPILRQVQKPYYRIGEAVELNRALAERGIEVLNNYILLTPETSLLEAIESLTLFVVLPIEWRDHGKSINLRITKEKGTRSHDEGLLFSPDDKSFDDPLRFPEVERLLRRWKLTAMVHSADLPSLIWHMLKEDRDAQRALPLVVRRWERDFDGDPFLRTFARDVRSVQASSVPLVNALREVAYEYKAAWPGTPIITTAPAPELVTGSPRSRKRSRRHSLRRDGKPVTLRTNRAT